MGYERRGEYKASSMPLVLSTRGMKLLRWRSSGRNRFGGRVDGLFPLRFLVHI